MSKLYLACMATLLVCTSAAPGQEQNDLPTPARLEEPPSAWNSGNEVFCSSGAGTCPTRGPIWTVNSEYILWFVANSHDTRLLAATDVLGRVGTSALGGLGDGDKDKREPVSGARWSLGCWQVQDNPWVPGGIRDLGAEVVCFFVGQRSAKFEDETTPNVVRPFFDLNNRRESAFIVAAPGLATGGISAQAQSQVWGAEANLWKNVYYDDPGTTSSVNLMVGLRYLELDGQLDIHSTSVFNQNLAAFPAYLPFAGNNLQVLDSFITHNRFYGAQIGVAGRWWLYDCLTADFGFKYGIGTNSEDLKIAGGQVRMLTNGTRIFTPAGLLALPSNIGNHQTNKFAQVPELDFKLSAPVSRWVTLSTGFTCLYWTRVIRPTGQIDRALDISQIPNFPPGASATPTGLGQPGVPFKQSDLWLLGFSLGLEVNW